MAAKIPEYTAQSPGIQAPETGIEATAQAARRIGTFYHQAGEEIGGAIGGAAREAQTYVDHQQISHGAVAYAGLMGDLTDEWNRIASTADPNDPTVAGRFRAQMEQRLDNFANGFTSEKAQNWAEARVDQLRNHFFEKTAADMATMSRSALDTNLNRVGSSLSNTARVDPSAVAHMLENGGTVDQIVDGLIDNAPNLRGPEAERARTELKQKIKQQIAHAGAFGAIEKSSDPEKAANDFSGKFPDYVNGVEAATLAKSAKAQAKSNQLMDRQALILAKEQNVRAADTAANKAFADNVQFDPSTNKATIDPKFFKDAMDVAKMPDAPVGLARTLLDWGQSQQRERREVINSDPGVRKNLLDNLFNPNQPTTQIDILRAEADEKLSGHDAATLRQLQTELESTPLKNPVFADTLKGVHSRLTSPLPYAGAHDPEAENDYAAFVQHFLPEYLKQSRAGTLPPNALDLKDPKSLISQSLAPFQHTMAERLQRAYGSMGGITGPGESIIGGAVTNTPAPPAIGEVRKGFRFKGGDPSKQSSWEKAQ